MQSACFQLLLKSASSRSSNWEMELQQNQDSVMIVNAVIILVLSVIDCPEFKLSSFHSCAVNTERH